MHEYGALAWYGMAVVTLAHRAAVVGIVVAAVMAVILVPRVPWSCGPSSNHSPGIELAVSPDNHDCTYSIKVGSRFALVDVPTRDLVCSQIACYPIGLHISNGNIASAEPPTPNRDEFAFVALSPGTVVMNPYRITIEIVR